MSRPPTNEEIKEYLIATSNSIDTINNVLKERIENIDSGGNIIFPVYYLITLGFRLDALTDNRYKEIRNQFSNHVS